MNFVDCDYIVLIVYALIHTHHTFMQGWGHE
jgi:hypothetical protein